MSDDGTGGGNFKETRVAEPKLVVTARQRPIVTVTSGREIGRVYSLGDQEITSIGRVDSCDIWFDDDSLSREHARVAIIGGTVLLQDRDSTNGTFVNGERVARVRSLEDGDRVTLGEGNTELRFALVTADEEAKLKAVWESTQRDGLTGLFNRKHLEELLDRSIARSLAPGDLAIVMVDIDHFKKVNDGHGHPAGDTVLREVAARIRKSVRPGDSVARYGGEEITLVLPGASPSVAAQVAEAVRQAIAIAPIAVGGGTMLWITASFGGAALSECEPRDKPTLFQRADARLYLAKQGGRNRVVADG